MNVATLIPAAVLDLVDGEALLPEVDASLVLQDPNTGKDLQPMMASAPGTIERALLAAERVHQEGAWARMPAEERAGWLDRMAVALQPRVAEVAVQESMTTGVPITQTSMLAFIVHAAFSLAAQQLRDGVLSSTVPGGDGRDIEVHRFPLGPSLALVPWNAPAPMAAHKVASALAAGVPVICKPSEFAPNGTGALADAAREIGLPPGVFQLLHGGPSVGGRLVTDPRIRAVSFTGGLAGGRAIASACAQDLKPTQLELGGNNPLVVLGDADPAAVATAVVSLLTSLNAQWCRALGQLLLPRARADEYLEAVLERLRAVRAGQSLDPATEFGPLIHSRHRDGISAQLAELVAAGGTAHATTEVPAQGNFMSPTLVTGVDTRFSREEIFGPVAAVHTYATTADAVALANGTPYGLEAYVVAGDPERGLAVARDIRAGEVKVNGASVLSLHLMTPRPAWGLSGTGVEGTIETINFFTGLQVVGVEVPSA